jgi:hypothetical protein
MFICKICNKEFGQITGKHLFKHGIKTVSEYKEMFPDSITVRSRKDTPETIEKKRNGRIGKKHTKETKEKIGAKHRGKKMSAEATDKWRKSYARYIEEHGSPMLGRDRDEAFKKKMSAIAKARPKELVDAKVSQMLAARRGSKATPEQRETYQNARLKYIAENPNKIPSRMFNTQPEQAFAKLLDEQNIPYVRNFRLENRLYDFKVLDDTLIEIDGPYHRTLGFYIRPDASDDAKVEKLRKYIERDRIKDQIAYKNGYFIYRIPVNNKLYPEIWIEYLEEYGCDIFKRKPRD